MNEEYPRPTEVIQSPVVALQTGYTTQYLANVIFPYLTMFVDHPAPTYRILLVSTDEKYVRFPHFGSDTSECYSMIRQIGRCRFSSIARVQVASDCTGPMS